MDRSLPPGQRAIEGFPRFGVDLDRPPPVVPPGSAVQVEGALLRPVAVTADDRARLPRRTVTSDFHCVAGWSALDLTWEGVRFADVHDLLVRPASSPGSAVRYVVFVGADGYRSVVRIEDALGDDVLIADRLDGAPLTPEHGAPVRLVSPSQYGYVSTKHLCRIELYPSRPVGFFHSSPAAQRALRIVHPHPRARVALEERHRFLPALVTRPLYRLVPLPARPLPSPRR